MAVDIFQEFKSYAPQESDEDIDRAITALQSKYPALNDEQLVAKGKELYDQHSNPSISASSISSSMKPAPMPMPSPAPDPLAAYSSEARSAAQAKADAENSAFKRKLGDALQVLGQGFMKNPDVAGAVRNAQGEREATNAKYLGAFDKNREAAIQDLQQSRLAKSESREDMEFAQKQEEMARKKDPNSDVSLAYRDLVKEMGVKADVSKLSAADIEERFPVISKMYDVRERAKDRALSREISLEGKKKASDEKKDYQTEKRIETYRNKLMSGPVYGAAYNKYLNAEGGKTALDEFKKDPNGYTDYGSLMIGLKSLQQDSSVVREAEIKLGKNAASLFTKAENAIQQAMDGKSLQPEQRQQIIDSLDTLSKVAIKQYGETVRPVYNQATREGLPADEIFPTVVKGYFEPDTKKSTSAITEEDIDNMSLEELQAAGLI